MELVDLRERDTARPTESRGAETAASSSVDDGEGEEQGEGTPERLTFAQEMDKMKAFAKGRTSVVFMKGASAFAQVRDRALFSCQSRD